MAQDLLSMNLTPHTTSPEFLQSYTRTLYQAGIRAEDAAAHYHGLRLKEACMNPRFRDGFTKQAGPWMSRFGNLGRGLVRGTAKTLGSSWKSRGPIQTGVDALWRTGRGLGKGMGDTSMSKALRGSFDGFSKQVRNETGELVNPSLFNKAKRGLGAFAFKELPIVGGITGLATGTNPLEALQRPGNPFAKPGVDNVNLPDFFSLKPDGHLDIDTASGGYFNMLQSSAQFKQLQSQIDQLEKSLPDPTDLRSTLERREMEETIRMLRKQQQNVGQGLRGSFVDFQDQVQNMGRDLNSTQRRLLERQLALEEKGQNLTQYMQDTEGNPLASIFHALPGINPTARGQRIVQEQDRVARNLEILSRLRSDLSKAVPQM